MATKKMVQSTAGVVLDPFSILMAGCIRKTNDTKTKVEKEGYWDILHGEAKFKQAFINACHFAETMTVFGPIAQLDWGRGTGTENNALFWKAPVGGGDNGEFFENLNRFLDQNKHLGVDRDSLLCPEGMGNFVHVMPDLTLNVLQGTAQDWQFRGKLTKHLYDESVTGMAHEMYYRGNDQHVRGGPVAALMAVTFTFKKPSGVFATEELTNLGGWPPVCFLLPVLVPQGTEITTNVPGSGVRRQVTRTQPMMMSYQLRLTNTEAVHKRTVPFGQPYNLTSVSKWGKPADTMRSLSDVFKALWSQATQYCAWNTQFMMDFPEDEEPPKSQVGELALDPIGAGRRIRGHNRFSNKYDMYGMSMLWEQGFSGYSNDEAPSPTGYNLGGLKTGPIKTQGNNSRDNTVVFVLPSYLGNETERNLMPVAMAAFRFMFAPADASGRLEDFLDGSTVTSVEPRDHLEPSSECDFEEHESYLDDMIEAHTGGVPGSTGLEAMPLHKVQSSLAFDIEGTPKFFGIRAPVGTPMGVGASAEHLADAVEVLHNFQFTEAFCSKSTRGLTEAFEKVKKVSAKKAAASGLTDDDVVDLFDVDDDEEMM